MAGARDGRFGPHRRRSSAALDRHPLRRAQTDANPHPYGVVQYIGYEVAGKRFVSVVVDVIEGSGYSTASAPAEGRCDDVTRRAPQQAVTNRDTFTANGNGFTHGGHELGKDGKWVKTDAETCSKR